VADPKRNQNNKPGAVRPPRPAISARSIGLLFHVEVDLRVGGTIRIHPPKGMEEHGDHKAEVLVCEPYRKLVFTWKQKDSPDLWTSDAHSWDQMNPALPKFEKYPTGNNT
jgi:Activator of Hsp90 ATPase homolog 1-like protein